MISSLTWNQFLFYSHDLNVVKTYMSGGYSCRMNVTGVTSGNGDTVQRAGTVAYGGDRPVSSARPSHSER